MSAAERVLDKAYGQVNKGRDMGAADVLMDWADDMFDKGYFGHVDEMCRLFDPVKGGLLLTVGALAATLPAKEHLPGRKDLLKRGAEALVSLGKDPKMLSGLE